MCKLHSATHQKGEKTWTSYVVILQWSFPLYFNTCVFSFKSYTEKEDRHLRLTSTLQKTAEDKQQFCQKHDACPNWRGFFQYLPPFQNGQYCCCHSQGFSSSLDALYTGLQCPPSFPWLSEIVAAEYPPNRISSLSNSTHLNAI